MSDFDPLVGRGTAANAASVTARSGLGVALIEKRELGGTCPLRGCEVVQRAFDV